MKKIMNNMKYISQKNMYSKTLDRKFQVISDIHLDNRKKSLLFEFIKIPANSSEINLIIAGDIGDPYKEKYWNFINDCSLKYKRVFFITGNHEYWNNNKTIEETDEHILKNIQSDNLYFLNNTDHYFEKENFRIYGTTLWTQFHEDNRDSKFIKNFSNNERNKKNKEAYEYIKKINMYNENPFNDIMKLNNLEYKEICVTHHLPIKELVHPKYINFNNKFYCNDFINEDFLNTIHMWVCGHSHTKMDFKHKACHFKLNPFGYMGEDTDYDDEIIYL